MKAPRPGRCLGDRIADLADGRLGPAVAERAYAHVAVCTRCRAALEAQREVRSRLAQSADPADGAEGDLMSRLRGIAATPASTAIPAQPAAGRTPAGAAGVRPGSGSGSASTRPAGARRRHRTRIAIASAAGAAALVVVAAVGGGSSAVSGPARPAPSIAPVVDRLTDAHESSADQMPFSGPRIVTAAFSAPSGSSSPQP